MQEYSCRSLSKKRISILFSQILFFNFVHFLEKAKIDPLIFMFSSKKQCSSLSKISFLTFDKKI